MRTPSSARPACPHGLVEGLGKVVATVARVAGLPPERLAALIGFLAVCFAAFLVDFLVDFLTVFLAAALAGFRLVFLVAMLVPFTYLYRLVLGAGREFDVARLISCEPRSAD